MSRKALLGALLAALIVFVWSFVSHMLLPWWETNQQGFSNEEMVATTLMAGAAEDGIYILPRFDPNDEAGQARMAEGPVAFVAFTRGGMDPMAARPMILQFVFNLLIALFMARLMACVGGPSFTVRLRMVVVIAVIAGLMVHMPYWAWYGFAGGFTVVSMLDLVIGWFLGGLVLARMAK